jgi:prophage antirepressor-like protein
MPIYGTYEEPLFKAKDIGVLLEIKDINSTVRNYSALHKCMQIMHTVRGEKEMIMLTELGLYKVLMNSKSNKIAEQFQDWVSKIIKR